MFVSELKTLVLSFGKCNFRVCFAIVTVDVVLHLINSKCVPILLYGLEVCPLNRADMQSLDFCVNRLLMKLFCSL